MKTRIQEIYRYFKILKNKNSNFSGHYKIEDYLKRLKISKLFLNAFIIFTLVILAASIFSVYNYELSTLNYLLLSVYNLLNIGIIIGLYLNLKKILGSLEKEIDYSLANTFTKAERNQFLRLKKLKNINNTKTE